MLPRYATIKSYQFEIIDEFIAESDEHKIQCRATYINKDNLMPTQQSQPQLSCLFNQKYNSKNTVRNYDISFQSSFMDQHQEAFRKQTQNFIEASLNQSNSLVIVSQSVYLFTDQNNLKEGSSINQSTTFQDQNQFPPLIYKYQKLKQFFQFLKKVVPAPVVPQFVILAEIAQQKYDQIKSPFITEEQIIQNSRKLASSKLKNLLNDQRINFLNLNKFSSEKLKQKEIIERNLASYIEFFFITFMLIAEQYFQNPYAYEQEGPKRQRYFNFQSDLNLQSLDQVNEKISCLGHPRKKKC